MSTPRTSRREFLRLAAFGSASIALVACGAGAPAADAPAEGGEAAAPAAEDVILTQWYHEYGEAGTQEAVYRIAEEYSELLSASA
jgi:multiple sugar transport system substrate-binding protein